MNMSAKIVNTGYEVLLAGILAAIIAQIIKFFLYTITHRKIDFHIFTTTGGMPSSHSAGVIGIACAVGIIQGFDSISFAIAMGYSLVVMYDAAGIRRASGKMATCLNRIMDDFYKHDVSSVGTKLKELLGHTPKEVFAGAVLGVAFAYYFHYFVLLGN